MGNCLYETFYISKKVSAILLYLQVHDETTVLLTKKNQRQTNQKTPLFQEKNSHCKVMHTCPAQQVSLIIWADKLQVKLTWNRWWEAPHKGGQGFLQSVAAPNDGIVAFKKDMIFLSCSIIVCCVYEVWGPLCLKSIDIAGFIFEEGQSRIPSGFVSIQLIFTLSETPIALGAEEWDRVLYSSVSWKGESWFLENLGFPGEWYYLTAFLLSWEQ